MVTKFQLPFSQYAVSFIFSIMTQNEFSVCGHPAHRKAIVSWTDAVTVPLAERLQISFLYSTITDSLRVSLVTN